MQLLWGPSMGYLYVRKRHLKRWGCPLSRCLFWVCGMISIHHDAAMALPTLCTWSPSLTGRLHGPLARYVKLRIAHAPGMPGTFSPPPRVSDPDMHHGTCVTHVSWCMPGSLTSGFLWSWWRGKRSRHFWRMHSPQFFVSGKRPMCMVSKADCDIFVVAWHTLLNILCGVR